MISFLRFNQRIEELIDKGYSEDAAVRIAGEELEMAKANGEEMDIEDPVNKIFSILSEDKASNNEIIETLVSEIVCDEEMQKYYGFA